MTTSAETYYSTNAKAMKSARSAMPEVIKGFGALHQSTMQSGSLTVIEKELIAIAIGLAVRCENCIYAHIHAALKAGASREQVLESAGVAVMMQGGPTYTYLPRVTEALDYLAGQNNTTLGV